jgi:hypothetical protein
VAVGATGLIRDHAVQYVLNQLPDPVLPQITGLRLRDQGGRIHEETPHSPTGRFRVGSPSPM